MTIFTNAVRAYGQVRLHIPFCKKASKNATSVSFYPATLFLMIALLLVGQVVSAHESRNENGQKKAVYRVRKGDTLYKIASAHGISVDVIKEYNKLYSATIQVGQTLVIPMGEYAAIVPKRHSDRKSRMGGFRDKHATEAAYTVAPQKTQMPAYDPANPAVISNGQATAALILSGDQQVWVSDKPATVLQPQPVVAGPYRPEVKMDKNQQQKIGKLPELRNEKLYSPNFLESIGANRQIFHTEENVLKPNWYTLYYRTIPIAEFRDNVPSNYTRKKDGIQYSGGSKVTYESIVGMGFPEQVASALSFVSSNEGGVSDLNFYDGNGSFGFIQFTLKYGSLEKFLSFVKSNNPTIYKSSLEKYGFVLEEKLDENNKLVEKLVVYAPEGYEGQTKLEGQILVDYLNDNKYLFGPLIMLGEQTRYEQIQSAFEQYFTPAQEMKLNIAGMERPVVASEIFETTVGITALTDLCVKAGVSGARKEIEAALNSLVLTQGIDANELSEMDDLQIVKQLVEVTDNPLIKKRMGKLVQESMTIAAR